MDLIQKLAETSVLGLVLGVALVAIVYLFKTVQALQEKRLEDAKQVAASIIKPIEQIDQNSRLLITLLQKLIDLSGGNHDK